MTHHRRGLRRLLKDDGLLGTIEAALAQDLGSESGPPAEPSAAELPRLAAVLDTRRHALLVYALKLTSHPSRMGRDDVERLRAAGLTDTDVLQLAEVVAYYAYVNRIADGLGVQLEQAD